MNRIVIAALLAAQIGSAAAPANAAEIVSSEPPRSYRTGAFVGARLRVPLTGERRAPRAVLALAPTLQSVQPNGERRTRINRGFEVGAEGANVRLEIAGQPASRLVAGGDAPGGRRSNVSTVGWVAIGVGALVVAFLALGKLCADGEICGSDRDP